jgi:cytochrome c peroxidase
MYYFRPTLRALIGNGIRTLVVVTALLQHTGTLRAQTKGVPFPKVESANDTGIARTITTQPSFDANNPFFQPLGINGRSCATCHALSEGFNMNPEFAQSLFDLTQGLDPLFAPVDGTNSPTADMSTLEARRRNTTMVRSKGLFRIGLKVPAGSEFTIEGIDDPYGAASATEVSVYRRPLPTSNLRFLTSVMWDGRELANTGSVVAALRSQVKDAVMGHMEATTPPSETQISQIVDFETSIYTSQIYDNLAGSLDVRSIRAGPEQLVLLPFVTGMNRTIGATRIQRTPKSPVFTLFGPWSLKRERPRTPATSTQLAIARGEKIFNARPFAITGVAGFNDRLPPRPLPASKRDIRRFQLRALNTPVRGTCSSCHNMPGIGSSSRPLLMNTGVSDGSRRTADMPLYTLRNKTTGERTQTTDPGAAMTTGKWRDIGKFKPPSLRGLETHSPYMHNGFSGDLMDIINFYDTRFSMGLTPAEKGDLELFLQAL